jgi:hypothetical protein
MFPHIETSKLTAFLLREEKLTENEEGHLLHCPDCMHSMVESSSAELDGGSSSGAKEEETE